MIHPLVAIAWIVFLGFCVYLFAKYKMEKLKRCRCSGLEDPHGLK